MLVPIAVHGPTAKVFAVAGSRAVPLFAGQTKGNWLAYKGRPAGRPAQPAKAPAPQPKEKQAPSPAAPKSPEPRPSEPSKKDR
jgi:hypothetical protein